MKAKILVAEDDTNIREGLVAALESEGYAVIEAPDGDAALDLFRSERLSLVLLDVMMPGLSGYDVCRAIRVEDPAIPIVMLTAKGEEIDKVLGLGLGADDYVTKPFGVRELLARIAAALRRARVVPGPAETVMPDSFRFGTANIQARQYRCELGTRGTDLTARELRLLEVFAQRPNEVLSRDTLLNDVWGIEYLGTTRTLDQHIAQLRKKVEQEPASPRVIVTVHGVGYKYVP